MERTIILENALKTNFQVPEHVTALRVVDFPRYQYDNSKPYWVIKVPSHILTLNVHCKKSDITVKLTNQQSVHIMNYTGKTTIKFGEHQPKKIVLHCLDVSLSEPVKFCSDVHYLSSLIPIPITCSKSQSGSFTYLVPLAPGETLPEVNGSLTWLVSDSRQPDKKYRPNLTIIGNNNIVWDGRIDLKIRVADISRVRIDYEIPHWSNFNEYKAYIMTLCCTLPDIDAIGVCAKMFIARGFKLSALTLV